MLCNKYNKNILNYINKYNNKKVYNNSIRCITSITSYDKDINDKYISDILDKIERPKSVRSRLFEPYKEPEIEAWIYNLHQDRIGITSLNKDIFGIDVRSDIMQRVVEWQRQKSRAKIIAVKSRADVVGSRKKRRPQKGTGNARMGDGKAPHNRGGGKALARKARYMEYDMPKRVRSLALKSALSAKQQESNLIILDNANPRSHKTQYIKSMLDGFGTNSALFIDGEDKIDANLLLGSRRLEDYKVDWLPAIGANVYDILNHRTLFITLKGLQFLESRLFRTPLLADKNNLEMYLINNTSSNVEEEEEEMI